MTLRFTFQIDFYTLTLVEGLVIYNRVLDRETFDGNEYFKPNIPVGCRSFVVSHAIFPEVFQLYMDQVYSLFLILKVHIIVNYKFMIESLRQYVFEITA